MFSVKIFDKVTTALFPVVVRTRIFYQEKKANLGSVGGDQWLSDRQAPRAG